MADDTAEQNGAAGGANVGPHSGSADSRNNKAPTIQIQVDGEDTTDGPVPEYNSLGGEGLLIPPAPGEMIRAASVEIIPPEERCDIDDEDFDEQKHVPDEHHVVQLKDAWRSRKNLANFLTMNHYFHIFVLIMVLLDVIVVLVELILDLELIKDNECRVDHDCPIARRENTSVMTEIQNCTFMADYDHCIYKDGKHRCQTADTHHDVDPAEVFHYLGIAILAYFNLEVLVKLFALDIKFFKHKLEVFDAVIVVTSLVLDVTIGGEGARESVSLLILLRLWRVTRIFNGITLAVEEREREKRHKIKHEREQALKDVARLQKIVHELKIEIHEWRDRAHVEATRKGYIHAPPEEEKKPPTKKSPHLPHLPHLPHIPHPHFGKKKKTSSEDSTEDNGSSQVAAEGAANVPETVEEQPSDTQPQEGAVESGPSDTSISVTQ